MFGPDVGALKAACQAFLNECRCPLCKQPWKDASSFPCGHTFCEKCAIATLEGPGISQSECPTCRIKYWKRDLKKNPQLQTAVDHAQMILGLSGWGAAANRGLVEAATAAPGARGADVNWAASDAEDSCGGRNSHEDGTSAQHAAAAGPFHVADGGSCGAGPHVTRPGQLARARAPAGARLNRHKRLRTEQHGDGLCYEDGAVMPELELEQEKAAPDRGVNADSAMAVDFMAGGRMQDDMQGGARADADVSGAVAREERLAAQAVGNVDPWVISDAQRLSVELAARSDLGHEPKLQGAGPLGLVPLGTRPGTAGTPFAEQHQQQQQQPTGLAFTFRTHGDPHASNAGGTSCTAELYLAAGLPGLHHPHLTPPGSELSHPQTGLSPFRTAAGDGACATPQEGVINLNPPACVHAEGAAAAAAAPAITATVATPNANLLPQPRLQPAAGWPSASNSKPPPGGTGGFGGVQRPGSVVSIRRSTPSVNNAYLQFHCLLEEAVVSLMGRLQADSIRQDAVQGRGLHADTHGVAAAVHGVADDDGWEDGFDEAAWLRRLAALPGPTGHEREALEFELSIVNMFLGEIDQRLTDAHAAGAEGEGAKGAVSGGSAGGNGHAVEAAAAAAGSCRGAGAADVGRCGREEEGSLGAGAAGGLLLQPQQGCRATFSDDAAAAAADGELQQQQEHRQQEGCRQQEQQRQEQPVLPVARSAASQVDFTMEPSGSGAQQQVHGRADAAMAPVTAAAADVPAPDDGGAGMDREAAGAADRTEGGTATATATLGDHDAADILPHVQPEAASVSGEDGRAAVVRVEDPEAAGYGERSSSGGARAGQVGVAAGGCMQAVCRVAAPEGQQEVAAREAQVRPQTAPVVFVRRAGAGLGMANTRGTTGQECGQEEQEELPQAGAGGAAAACGVAAGRRRSAPGSMSPHPGKQQLPQQQRRIVKGPGAEVAALHAASAEAPLVAPAAGLADKERPQQAAACLTGGQRRNGGGSGTVAARKGASRLLRESAAPRSAAPRSPSEEKSPSPPPPPPPQAAADVEGAAPAPAPQGRRRREAGAAAAARRHRSEPPPPPPPQSAPPGARQHQQPQSGEGRGALPPAGAAAGGPRRGRGRDRESAATGAAPPPPAAAAALGAGGAAGARRQKPCYVLSTGLASTERARLRELARRVRGVELVEDVTPHLTHLVVKLTPQGRAAVRTVKYLHAVMQGCWVVGVEWAEACLAAGRLVAEEPFEATGDPVHEGTPARGRMRVERGEPPLFTGLSFCVSYLKGTMDNKVLRADLEALLQTSGGRIVRRPSHRAAPAPAAAPPTFAAALFGTAAAADLYDGALASQQPPSSTTTQSESAAAAAAAAGGGVSPRAPLPPGVPPVIVLVEGRDVAEAGRVVREWGCAPVVSSWVFDSISHYQVLPIESYTVFTESQAHTTDTTLS